MAVYRAEGATISSHGREAVDLNSKKTEARRAGTGSAEMRTLPHRRRSTNCSTTPRPHGRGYSDLKPWRKA